MHLENLNLANFKNYTDANIDFSPDINALLGTNGSGKTNLLDAIHFLSMTKSAFNSTDNQCIQHNKAFYSIIGKFKFKDKHISVSNSLTSGKKKRIQVDSNPIDRATDFIGNFPIVLIAPSDQGLIMEGGESRRKYIDSIVAQLDKSYLLNVVDYNHALKQRNKLLKQFAESEKLDMDLLEPYDQLLITIGQKIYQRRRKFCETYLQKIKIHYQYLSKDQEEISLGYESDFLKENFKSEFKSSLKKDLVLQRTTMGIHKDDYLFEMDGYPIKKFGSQGQQKSFLIALKLAQFDILREEKGFKPILLMDDIFDKLDDLRILKLTEMIEHHEFGQVFITDARPERTYHFLDKLNVKWKAINVENGKFVD